MSLRDGTLKTRSNPIKRFAQNEFCNQILQSRRVFPKWQIIQVVDW